MDVTSLYSFGILPALLTLLLLVVIAIFYMGLKKDGGDLKDSRYEAGNPPKYEARVRYGMQYLGFFIIFASFEPIVLIFLLLSSASSYYANKIFYLVLLGSALLIPILFVSLKISEKKEEWMWD
ncbi:MAG: NADH-quinone oxidoreductase subunit A [Fervidicoccaceae archaeon]